MKSPLTLVLTRIFVRGFYQAHAGMFMFFFLVIIGAVDPGQLLGYHKTLMLAFITSPVMLAAVFAVWLLYMLKCWHYIAGQITAPQQHFLFYSVNSFEVSKQFKSWFVVQLLVLLPVMVYGLTAAGMGIAYHYYITSVIIVVYLLLLLLSAWFYVMLINRLVSGGGQYSLPVWSSRLKKPYYSLYIYHVLNRLKIPYLITKTLSWLIITGVFYLFADVKSDARVAGMAILAIAVAHAVLVFEKHRFEHTYLGFARNFPYTRSMRYVYNVMAFALLFLPETVWLFTRFNFILAVQLALMALSMLMLLNSLIYRIGLNMDKYLQWLMGLFILLFWVMMFKLMHMVILGSLAVSYLIYYRCFYRDMPVVKHNTEE